MSVTTSGSTSPSSVRAALAPRVPATGQPLRTPQRWPAGCGGGGAQPQAGDSPPTCGPRHLLIHRALGGRHRHPPCTFWLTARCGRGPSRPCPRICCNYPLPEVPLTTRGSRLGEQLLQSSRGEQFFPPEPGQVMVAWVGIGENLPHPGPALCILRGTSAADAIAAMPREPGIDRPPCLPERALDAEVTELRG